MALKDFLPTREAELVTWSNAFAAGISSAPTAVGLTAAQATTFSGLNDTWVAAYELATADATNSRANIEAKKLAKRAMVVSARQLAGIIQKFPGTTDVQRVQLGLTVPTPPAPAPRPETSPIIDVISSANWIVKLRLRDAESTRRGRPKHVALAYIFAYIGETAPTDVNQWSFQGSVSTVNATVAFSSTTPAGAKVWFTSCWLNARQQPGELATPVSANIVGGVSNNLSGEDGLHLAA